MKRGHKHLLIFGVFILIGVLFLPFLLGGNDLQRNLISYYKADVDEILIDSHGTNNGTIEGAIHIPSGALNGAYSFDGGDNISLANFFSFEDDFTISLWIYINDTSRGHTILDNRTGNSDKIVLRLDQNPDVIRFVIDGTSYDLSLNADFQEKDWEHLVVTRSDNVVAVYLNNSDVGSTTAEGTLGIDGIGMDSSFPSSNMNGSIDEIGFWNTSLTTSQVLDLYNGGIPLSYDSFTFTPSPEVSLVSPPNNTSTQIGNISFVFTPQCYSNCTKAVLYFNKSGINYSTIQENEIGAVSVADAFYLVDLDRDGDIDVFAANATGGEVWGFEQTAFDTWASHLLISGFSDIQGINFIDFDGNEVYEMIILDKLGISVSLATPSNSSNLFGTWNNFTLDGNNSKYAQDSMEDDVDGDGDSDFYYTYGGTSDGEGGVFWMEYKGGNVSNSSNWEKHLVSQIDGAWWINNDLLDLNNDGNANDLVVTARTKGNPSGNDEGVYWLEKPSDVSNIWTKNVVVVDGPGYGPITSGDFCGDERSRDLVVSPFEGGSGIYRYCFSENYSLSHTITSNYFWYNAKGANLDNDGRDELVLSNLNLSTLEIWSYSFDGEYEKESSISYDKSDDNIFFYDLVGDGYYEIFTNSQFGGKVSWFNFSRENVTLWRSRDSNLSLIENNTQNTIYSSFSEEFIDETINWNIKIIDSNNIGRFSIENYTLNLLTNVTSSQLSENETTSGGGGTPTFSPSRETLRKGYTKIFYETWKVKVYTNNDAEKIVKISEVSVEKVDFTIDDKTYSVDTGNLIKIDLDEDGFYDLQISVLSSNGISARLEFKEIHEEVPAGEEGSVSEQQKVSWFKKNKEILIAVGIVVLIFGLIKIFGRKR